MFKLLFNFNLFNNTYYIYERLLVLLFSLVPTLLLMSFVLYTDRKDKEPAKNIIICLLSGILTIAFSGYFENIIGSYISNSFILTYAWAFIEELSKFLIFSLFIFDNKYYDDLYDGIVYMALIALSFAGLENIMYAFSESTVSSSISLALMRDFTTIPLHVICGIVIGYFSSLSNFSKNKTKKILNLVLALVIPTLMHGTFNSLMNLLSGLIVGESYLNIFIFQTLPLIVIIVILLLIGILVVNKILNLNIIFMQNLQFSKKYDYIMNKNEYNESYEMNKRLKMHNKTKLRS